MPLNLHQVREQIKSGPRPNPANPTADMLLMSDLYKALKSAGWQSTGQVHPTDRVSTLTLDGATIRRDKEQPAGAWIIEVAGQDYPFTGSAEEATAEARRLLAAAEPAPETLSPAQEIALDLKSEYRDYPELFGRIDKAAQLVDQGVTEFPQYNTRYSPETFYGLRECDCPDVQNRDPRAKFGSGCKHTFAQEIAARIERERERVAHRKLTDLVEGARR